MRAVSNAKNDIETDNASLDAVSSLVTNTSGLVLGDARHAGFIDAVRERMETVNAGNVISYLDILNSDASELYELISILTIKETYFMREPDYLNMVAERIVPDLLAKKGPGGVLRILSAGCSVGAEPYSIAIVLVEKYGIEEVRRFARITGFDLDRRALRHAELAEYGHFYFRGLENGLLRRYFKPAGQGHMKLDAGICGLVALRRMNLMSDIYPPDLHGADIIFYRNVSIYFDMENRQRVFGQLASLLSPGGYMILSSAETMSYWSGPLSKKEIDGLYVFRRDEPAPVTKKAEPAPANRPERIPGGKTGTRKADRLKETAHTVTHQKAILNLIDNLPAVKAVVEISEGKSSREFFLEARSHAEAQRYDLAMEAIDSAIKLDHGFLDALALKAGLLMNQGKLNETVALCEAVTRSNPLHFEACYLLGFAAKLSGDMETARRRFLESLFINSASWQCHFQLAEIYRMEGDAVSAVREYKAVLKCAGKSFANDHGSLFLRMPLDEKQLTGLCNRHIEALKKTVVMKA